MTGRNYTVPANAHALRLVRCVPSANRFVFYEAVTFPNDPTAATIDMYLRRASICGKIGSEVDSDYTVDLVDADDNTLAEYPIERAAARYLVEKLKLRVERSA